MIRKIFLSYFLLILTHLAIGQNGLGGFSINSGLSISSQSYSKFTFGNVHQGKGTKILSPFINIQYAIPIKNFSILFGAQVIEKGFSFSYISKRYGDLQFDLDYQILLNYIEMPLGVSYKFDDRLIFQIGTITSYLLEANYRYKEVRRTFNTPTIFVSNYSQKQYDRFKNWDFGLNFGLSSKIINGLYLDLSVQRHFVNADNWNTTDIMFNEVYLVGLRYKFLKNKKGI
jgi:hypothetical protein